MAALGELGLASVIIGDYLIIFNNCIDVVLEDEPYISFMLFYNTTSGKFFKRIWNRTVAAGKTTDLAALIKISNVYFNLGKPCIALIPQDGQNELHVNASSACHSFIATDSSSKRVMCSECQKINDTINHGWNEADSIKVEDFDDIQGENQYYENPFEEALEDSSSHNIGDTASNKICSEQSMATNANVLREQHHNTNNMVLNKEVQDDEQNSEQTGPALKPKLSNNDLIVEALEGGKTLALDEIMKSISDKHAFFKIDTKVWRKQMYNALNRSSRFEHVDEAGNALVRRGRAGGSKWRLNTSSSISAKCDHCDKIFPEGKSSSMYNKHMMWWHGLNKFNCSSCEFKAKFAADIFQHIKEVGHKDTTLTCPLCKNCFDETGMSSHYQKCFRLQQKERIKKSNLVNLPCPTCGKVIKTKRAYRQHLMGHLRKQGEQEPVDVPYSNGEKYNLYHHCDKCDKKFSHKYILKKHVQVSFKMSCLTYPDRQNFGCDY